MTSTRTPKLKRGLLQARSQLDRADGTLNVKGRKRRKWNWSAYGSGSRERALRRQRAIDNSRRLKSNCEPLWTPKTKQQAVSPEHITDTMLSPFRDGGAVISHRRNERHHHRGSYHQCRPTKHGTYSQDGAKTLCLSPYSRPLFMTTTSTTISPSGKRKKSMRRSTLIPVPTLEVVVTSSKLPSPRRTSSKQVRDWSLKMAGQGRDRGRMPTPSRMPKTSCTRPISTAERSRMVLALRSRYTSQEPRAVRMPTSIHAQATL